MGKNKVSDNVFWVRKNSEFVVLTYVKYASEPHRPTNWIKYLSNPAADKVDAPPHIVENGAKIAMPGL